MTSESLRDEYDAIKADIASLRKEGKTTGEIDALFEESCHFADLLFTALREIEKQEDS